ncbi:MAG TPA: glycosyltransferase family 2 protein [Candidatus Acidoferrales bacterium]|nr:glycosyltransferase family 2 protein [Candidatus Acidoferrales bacterium]
MNYDTAFRPYLAKRIEQIEAADIVVGIPCYNNEKTIAYVLKQVSRGLAQHFKPARSVILVSDGGSTDDTREIVRDEEIQPWQEKVVFIYRGIAGKGSALRAIFEAVEKLNAKACAVVDADLRSITPDWVRFLLEPVLEKNYHFVAPVYTRHKYDGTITNHVVYNFTRALYGKRIRQPIGGDFGFSRELANFYQRQNIWTTDVARFGIDIWMTTQAIAHGFRICQSNLGVKVHDPKEPTASLGPMFRQVVYTLFTLMEQNAEQWQTIQGSEPVETFGEPLAVEPEPVEISLDALIYNFKQGFQQLGVLWKEVLSAPCYELLTALNQAESQNFLLPARHWARMLYELAATFHHWPTNRDKLIDLMSPLYYARVASFVNETAKLKSHEVEQLIEEQADLFEKEKGYLLQLWEREVKEPADKTFMQKLLRGWRG